MKRKSMIKKMALLWLLAVLPSLACMAVTREGVSTTTGFLYRYDTETHMATIISGGTGIAVGDIITIPTYDTVDGIDVCIWEIGDGAFDFKNHSLENMCKVKIEAEYLDRIGEYAFRSAIAEDVRLTLPSNLSIIGKGAFQGCDIISVTIPDHVTVGDYAFADCRFLKTVSMADYVTLGSYVFSECLRLHNVDFGTGITTIPPYAFKHNLELNSITLPNTVKTIQEGAFSETKNLHEANLNEGLETIGDKAFYIANIVHIVVPNTVTSIGDFAFYTNSPTNLNLGYPSLDLGFGVKTIGNHAFEGNNLFDELVIPDQVEWIGDYAFRDCATEKKPLINITFGKGLCHLGEFAFADNIVMLTLQNDKLLHNVPSNAFSDSSISTEVRQTLYVPEWYFFSFSEQTPWTNWFEDFVILDMDYPLWVGGVRVNSDNKSNLADGKAFFDCLTNTLTLNNATITPSFSGMCISNGKPESVLSDGGEGIDGLIIKVFGNCTLTSSNGKALALGNNTTITGSGKLEIKGKTAAIYLGSDDNLTISGGVTVIASGNTGVVCGNSQSGKLTVDNATFEATPLSSNTFAISGIEDIELTNCGYRDPGGAWRYSDTSKFFYEKTDKWIGWGDEGYYKGKEIIIKPTSDPVDYRLFLNGTRVNSSNCNNIPVQGKTSGTAKWDNATKTLTLTNLNATSDLKVSGISSGNINRNMQAMPELNIELEGDNKFTITSEEGKGLYVNRGNVTIKGNGKLELKSSGEEGIFVEANSILNLRNTEVVAYGKHCAIKGISSSNMVVNHSKLFASSDDDEEVTIQGLSGFDLVNAKYETLNMGLSEFHNDWCIFYGQYFNYDANNSVLCYNGIYTNYDYGYDEDLSCDWKHSVSIVPTEISISTNISEPVTQPTTDQPMYNVAGQRVGKDYKGIVIQNGKKVVVK